MPTSTETNTTSGIRVKSILPMTLFVLLQCVLIGSGLYISTNAIQAEGATIDSLKMQNNILRSDRDAERYADSILFGEIRYQPPAVIHDTVNQQASTDPADTSKLDAREVQIADLKATLTRIGIELALCQEKLPTSQPKISRSGWDSVVRQRKSGQNGSLLR
jgi:hypothetical protein